jgi:hypothetical protein
VQAFSEKLQRHRSAFDRHGLRISANQPDGDRGTAGVVQRVSDGDQPGVAGEGGSENGKRAEQHALREVRR